MELENLVTDITEAKKYAKPANFMPPLKKTAATYSEILASASKAAALEYAKTKINPKVYCAVLLNYGIGAKVTIGKLADDVNFISHLQLEVLGREYDVRPVDSMTIYVGYPSASIGRIPDMILKEILNAPIWQLV